MATTVRRNGHANILVVRTMVSVSRSNPAKKDGNASVPKVSGENIVKNAAGATGFSSLAMVSKKR